MMPRKHWLNWGGENEPASLSLSQVRRPGRRGRQKGGKVSHTDSGRERTGVGVEGRGPACPWLWIAGLGHPESLRTFHRLES